MDPSNPPVAGSPPGGRPQPGRLTAMRADITLAAAVLAVSAGSAGYVRAVTHAPVTVALTTLPLTSLPLLWRRRRPGIALLVLTGGFAAAAGSAAGGAEGFGLVAGGYAAALYGTRRTRRTTGIAAMAALIAAAAVMLLMADTSAFPGMGGSPAGDGALAHLTAIAFLFPLAWVLGERTRTRRAYVAGLVQRADRLERERDEQAARAAAAERGRIARELHDVVTHNVSVIAVQAGAARRISGADPGRALACLGTIEETARSTLTELRALLGVLRKGSDEAPGLRQPQPSLTQYSELARQAREAGIHLEVRVDGKRRPLPSVVDLCAYRVIQEAFTNLIRHAPGSRAHLLIRYGERELRIVVVDNGPGRTITDGGDDGPPSPASGPPAAGHGLAGMHERVSLTGGVLLTGPALGGGFRIEARLPLGAALPPPGSAVARPGRAPSGPAAGPVLRAGREPV